jgi:hypothetical protein
MMEADNMRMQCKTCQFFVMMNLGADEIPGSGNCQRHAPRTIQLGMEGGWRWKGWPAVKETDFCGDFRPMPLDTGEQD